MRHDFGQLVDAFGVWIVDDRVQLAEQEHIQRLEVHGEGSPAFDVRSREELDHGLARFSHRFDASLDLVRFDRESCATEIRQQVIVHDDDQLCRRGGQNLAFAVRVPRSVSISHASLYRPSPSSSEAL